MLSPAPDRRPLLRCSADGPVHEFAALVEEIGRAVLDVVTEHELRLASGTATRRHIRTCLKKLTPRPDIDAMNRAIDALVGPYLEVVPGSEQSFQVRCAGLFASRWGTNALTIVDRTMALLRDLTNEDPSLSRYPWRAVRATAGLPRKALNLAYLSITHAKLGVVMLETEGDRWWTTPPDLDILLDCESALDHVRRITTTDEVRTMSTTSPDPRKIFIIHGRNLEARKQMGIFVRALGLVPINFADLRAQMGGTPTVAEIVERGMSEAHGVIALFTPDEYAAVQPQFRQSHDRADEIARWQARPNVIFEAGMAFGRDRSRVVFVVFGNTTLFTDVAGIHVLRPTNEASGDRAILRNTLSQGMGCMVEPHSTDWMSAGDFESCVPTLPEVSARDPFREDEPAGHKPEIGEDSESILKWLASEYVKAGYPNHRAWSFSPRDEHRIAFNELRARRYIEAMTLGGQNWRLTDFGQSAILRIGAVADPEESEGRGKGTAACASSSTSSNGDATVIKGADLIVAVGRASSYFASPSMPDACVLDDALVLIYAGEINATYDVLPVLEQVARSHKALLLVADKIIGEAMATLITNFQRGTVQVCAVQLAPHVADVATARRTIARFTNGTIVGDEAGITLRSAQLSQLGRATRIVSGEQSTTITNAPQGEATADPTARGGSTPA